jgi:hypothetical protein
LKERNAVARTKIQNTIIRWSNSQKTSYVDVAGAKDVEEDPIAKYLSFYD